MDPHSDLWLQDMETRLIIHTLAPTWPNICVDRRPWYCQYCKQLSRPRCSAILTNLTQWVPVFGWICIVCCVVRDIGCRDICINREEQNIDATVCGLFCIPHDLILAFHVCVPFPNFCFVTKNRDTPRLDPRRRRSPHNNSIYDAHLI